MQVVEDQTFPNKASRSSPVQNVDQGHGNLIQAPAAFFWLGCKNIMGYLLFMCSSWTVTWVLVSANRHLDCSQY